MQYVLVYRGELNIFIWHDDEDQIFQSRILAPQCRDAVTLQRMQQYTRALQDSFVHIVQQAEQQIEPHRILLSIQDAHINFIPMCYQAVQQSLIVYCCACEMLILTESLQCCQQCNRAALTQPLQAGLALLECILKCVDSIQGCSQEW